MIQTGHLILLTTLLREFQNIWHAKGDGWARSLSRQMNRIGNAYQSIPTCSTASPQPYVRKAIQQHQLGSQLGPRRFNLKNWISFVTFIDHLNHTTRQWKQKISVTFFQNIETFDSLFLRRKETNHNNPTISMCKYKI